MRRRGPFGVVALALAAVVGGGGVSQAADATTLVKVSGPSPYASCRDAGQDGSAYTNAEVEPQVAVNPRHPRNFIGVFQQDRWTTGASRGDAAAYTQDGGATWHETTLPFSKCAPGGLAFDRATDPWVSIGPDGTAYVVGLSLDSGHDFSGRNAIVAAVSRDKGHSWGTVRVIRQNPDGTKRFNDKESVTADPTHAGVAYAVWDVGKRTPSPHFRQPTLFSRTTDWGRTWSKPVEIAGTAMDEATIDNTIVVDPADGTLYNFYALYYCVCWSIPRIEFVESHDGGRTWSSRHVVDAFDTEGIWDPRTGGYIRTGDVGASVAIDPGDGTLYAAWQSARFSHAHVDQIALSVSHNHGRSWSQPRLVNRPTESGAFLAAIAVSLEGAVGLTYYDFRYDDRSTPSLTTTVWFRSSWDRGATWSRDQPVKGRFNFEMTPQTEGPVHFLGDYVGLAAAYSFVPFFTAAPCLSGCTRNRTDVYAASIDPARPGAPHTAGRLPIAGRVARPSRASEQLPRLRQR